MKIVSVEVIPIKLPYHAPFYDSLGSYVSSNHGIVIIHSESGEYGVGEIALAWFGGAHALCKEINEFWVKELVGEQITNITAICLKLDNLCQFSKRHLLAKAGIEMALYDLIGKTLQIPVYQLIGGKVRDKILLTGGIPIDTIENMVECAKRRIQEGYKELKIKVGLDDQKDLKTIHEIRNAIPDTVLLRADVNMAWKGVKKAKKMMDEMYNRGVFMIEQPLLDSQLADLVYLRDNTKVLLLIDESVWDVEDAKKVLDCGAADVIHVYISEAGGISAAKRIFELASLYQIDCTIGSMPEARIGTSASAQVGIAMSNLSAFASDIRGFTLYRDDVVNENIVIQDGYLWVSDLPGLGVSLDFVKLKALQAR